MQIPWYKAVGLETKGGVMPEPPRVGPEIAGYRLESLVERGGVAVVYIAEHIRLGRKVAFKILAGSGHRESDHPIIVGGARCQAVDGAEGGDL